MDEMKVGLLQIQGKVLKFNNTLIQIKNISKVTTFIPKPSFPTTSIWLLVIGLVLAVFGLGNLRSMGFILVIGIVLLAAGAGWLGSWYKRCQEASKGLTLFLNSGERETMLFSDRVLADRVMEALGEAMREETTVQSFDLSNAILINSPIGNINGQFSFGGGK